MSAGDEVIRLRAELAQAKREYRDAMRAIGFHAETIGLLHRQRDEARAVADRLSATPIDWKAK